MDLMKRALAAGWLLSWAVVSWAVVGVAVAEDGAPLSGAADLVRGRELLRGGDPRPAAELFNRIYSAAVGEGDGELRAQALDGLTAAFLHQGQVAEAIEIHERAMEARGSLADARSFFTLVVAEEPDLHGSRKQDQLPVPPELGWRVRPEAEALGDAVRELFAGKVRVLLADENAGLLAVEPSFAAADSAYLNDLKAFVQSWAIDAFVSRSGSGPRLPGVFAELFLTLGRFHVERSELDVAARAVTRSIELNATAGALEWLSAAYLRYGLLGEGAELYLRAQDLKEHPPQPLLSFLVAWTELWVDPATPVPADSLPRPELEPWSVRPLALRVKDHWDLRRGDPMQVLQRTRELLAAGDPSLDEALTRVALCRAKAKVGGAANPPQELIGGEACAARVALFRTRKRAEGSSQLPEGEGIEGPKRLHEIPPSYTRAARRARLQGPVVIEVVIDAEGCPRDLKVLKELPQELSERGKAAVQQWVFRPAMLGGCPVVVEYNLTINFTLH